MIYKKKYKRYADGGDLNDSPDDPKPQVRVPVKNFYANYMESPMYKKRLQNFNINSQPDVQSLLNTNIMSERGRTSFAIDKNESNRRIDRGDNILNFPNLKENVPNINIDRSQIEDAKEFYNANLTPEQIVAHELSHVARKLSLGEEAYIKARELKSSSLDTSHDTKPNEIKADLDALRYQMQKKNLYDTSKRNMTLDDYNKVLNDKEINQTLEFKRLQKVLKPQDLIQLNNTIASVPSEDTTQRFSNGGDMKKPIYKKYAYGGYGSSYLLDANGNPIDSSGFPIPTANLPKAAAPTNPNSTLTGLSSAATFAGNFLQNIAPNSEIGSIGGSALSMAGQGAGIGTMIAPGIGTAIGGAVGAVGGVVSGLLGNKAKKKAQQQQAEAQEKQRGQMQHANDVEALSQYDTTGNNIGSGYYANGGFLERETNKQVYRGYKSMVNPHYYPKMAEGGYIEDPTTGVPRKRSLNPVDALSQMYSTMRPSQVPTYDPNLLTNGQFVTTHDDGTMGQWGKPWNPLPNEFVGLPQNNIPPIIPSNKAMGYDNTYTPSRDRQQGKDIPTIHRGYGYGNGGFISPYHSGNIIDKYGRSFADGGDLSIDPSHKGDFTAYLKRTGKTAHEAVQSDDPHVRKMAQYAINIGHTKMANGGELEGDSGEGVPLASDVQKFVGPSHANGGIPIDADGDGQPDAEVEGDEVQKGNQIYSDRLAPSPQLLELLKQNKISVNGTYADVATKLGSMKGKYETKVTSYSPQARRTGKAMGDRIEDLMQATFQDQEMTKPAEPQQQRFAVGGTLDGPDDPRIKAYNDYLYKKKLSKDRGDTGVQDYDYNKRQFVPIQAPQIPQGYEEYTTRDGDLMLRPNGSTMTSPLDPNSRTAPSQGLPSTTGAYQGISPENFASGNLFAPTNYFPNLPSNGTQGLHSSSGGWDTPVGTNPSVVPGASTPNTPSTPLVRRGATSTLPYTGRRSNIRGAALPAAVGTSAIAPPTYGSFQSVTDPNPPQGLPIPQQGTSTLDTINGVIDKYGADAMNLATYIGNQSSINKMKAPEFKLAPPPRYNYNDRSGLAKNENSIAAKYMAKGLTNTSSQGRAAQIAQIDAQQIAGNNQINQQENQRHDAYNDSYNQRVLQNDYTNTDITNRQADITTQVNNEKLGLSTQNRNALNQGFIANDASRRQEDLDRQKALTILASTPDPDKALNLLTKFMNPQMAKRLQQLYKKG